MQRPDDRGLMMNRVEEVLVQGSEEELQELKVYNKQTSRWEA